MAQMIATSLNAGEIKTLRRDTGLPVGGNMKLGAAFLVAGLDQHGRQNDLGAAVDSLFSSQKEMEKSKETIKATAQQIEQIVKAADKPPSKAARSSKGSTGRRSSAQPTPKELLERALGDGGLTQKGWLELLHAAKVGDIEPSVAGGAAPSTTKQHGTSANGTKASEQYRIRFHAWHQGLPAPAEPPSQLPASQLPPATSCVYISHLSVDERAACKVSFIALVRDQIAETVELSSRPHLNSLLRHAALFVVEWLEENMHVNYAAELMHTDDDGKGRERVRGLHSPIGFIREYIRADDPQFFAELDLTQEESDGLMVAILLELMIATFETNFETHRLLCGLPYVPFRGVLVRRGDLIIMINESGHFQAYYADKLASEDMAWFHKCETGRGLNQLYKAGGQQPGIVNNATVALDLWRAPADTRKMHQGPGDSVERSYKTATPYRRAMEAGAQEEPFPSIAQWARKEHGWRLLFFRGFGAKQERVRCYGDPSTYFTESRLSIEPAAQQRTLFAALKQLLTPQRLKVVTKVPGGLELDAADCSALPFVEQHFFPCIHLQDVYASGAAIFRVHKLVYLLDCDETLTEEQLKVIDHEMKIEMNKDITAKLTRARADWDAARLRLARVLVLECIATRSIGAILDDTRPMHCTPKLEALLATHKLLRQAEHVANSRSRGGNQITCRSNSAPALSTPSPRPASTCPHPHTFAMPRPRLATTALGG